MGTGHCPVPTARDRALPREISNVKNIFEKLKITFSGSKYWLYAAIFCLPIERVFVFNVFGATVRPTHVFLLIGILIWFYKKIFEVAANKNAKILFEEYRSRFSKIYTLQRLSIIFFIIMGLGLFFSPDLNRSLFVFVSTVFILSLSIFIPQFFHKIKEVATAIKVFLVSSLVTCVFGLYQFIADMAGLGPNWTFLTEKYTKSILGFTRVQGLFIEPLYFADFLLLPIVFCSLFLLNKVKSERMKWFLRVTLVLSLINFVLTSARGAFLAGLAVLILFAVFNYSKISRKIKIAAVSALVLISLAGTLIYFIAPSGISGQFIYRATHPFQGAAFQERQETFKEAWLIFKEHPWLGSGPGSFGILAPLKAWESRQDWKIVNNLYLEILAENGIWGFLAIMSFFVLLLFYLYKAMKASGDKLRKILLEGFFWVIIAILIQYNSFSIIYLPFVWIVVGLAMAEVKIKVEGMPRMELKGERLKRWR